MSRFLVRKHNAFDNETLVKIGWMLKKVEWRFGRPFNIMVRLSVDDFGEDFRCDGNKPPFQQEMTQLFFMNEQTVDKLKSTNSGYKTSWKYESSLKQ